MIAPHGQLRVDVATRPVDFRKGMDGLGLAVQEVMGLDPLSGAAARRRPSRSDRWRLDGQLLGPMADNGSLFRAKRADRIKVLISDRTWMVLVYKRLEGAMFVWPQVQDGVMKMSPAQFPALFEGLDWRLVRPERVRRPTVAG